MFEKRDIGRALARVIVHELVHVVLPARPHSRSGLMAVRLGRDVLLWPGTEIEPALAGPFLAGLAAWPTRLDVPKAVGGTFDGAATSMNLKASEQLSSPLSIAKPSGIVPVPTLGGVLRRRQGSVGRPLPENLRYWRGFLDNVVARYLDCGVPEGGFAPCRLPGLPQ